MSVVTFWEDFQSDIDLVELAASSIAVKGKRYKRANRFLEIYANLTDSALTTISPLGFVPHIELKRRFLPSIPGLTANFGKGVYQPPFVWNDCSARALAINFTYNTNAIFRILSNLADEGAIPHAQVDQLLDRACVMLSQIYKSEGNEIMRHMNNNINMCVISKVAETLVGKTVYDSDTQEPRLTAKSLRLALDLVNEHANLTPRQQMALALGKGVAFIESYVDSPGRSPEAANDVRSVSYRYVESSLRIDHRDALIGLIAESGGRGRGLRMCAILDDTVESVDDILWIQALMRQFPHFTVDLLLNTAQVSINFSYQMLEAVLSAEPFSWLASRLGRQLYVTTTYCPLISFQTNYLEPAAQRAVRRADLVYVKGLNFFETCQFVEKDVFHAFVVYGPISRLYTGLNDYDGVFAFVPSGTVGYAHNRDETKIKSLQAIMSDRLMGERS